MSSKERFYQSEAILKSKVDELNTLKRVSGPVFVQKAALATIPRQAILDSNLRVKLVWEEGTEYKKAGYEMRLYEQAQLDDFNTVYIAAIKAYGDGVTTQERMVDVNYVSPHFIVDSLWLPGEAIVYDDFENKPKPKERPVKKTGASV